MNLPPKDSYDSVVLFWFEKYMEDHKFVALVGARTEKALKEHVAKGFWTHTGLHYCAVTFFKNGTQLELWEQLERRVDYV